MMRSLCALLVVVFGCGSGNAASNLATPPTYSPQGQEKCSVAVSHSEPLIVEWPSAERGRLEAEMRSHVVAVQYANCEMRVLTHCEVNAKYNYKPITRKHEQVSIRDEDALYANMPMGAARF